MERICHTCVTYVWQMRSKSVANFTRIFRTFDKYQRGKIRFNSAPTRHWQEALRIFVFSLSSQKHIECRMDSIRNNYEHDALKTEVFLYIYYKTYYFVLLCFCPWNASFFFSCRTRNNGPQYEKTNKMPCLPSEDSDQPAPPPHYGRSYI